MLKVSDVFPVGNMFSVTIEGVNINIRNGSRFTDINGNLSDISKSTTIVTNADSPKKGDELSVL